MAYVLPFDQADPPTLNEDQISQMEKAKAAHTWTKVINLIQEIYRNGKLPQRLNMSTLIMLPKGDNDVRGIGLVESVWKVLGKIINRRIQEVVKFHPCVHGFRKNKGTGTAILEVKLLATLALEEKETVYQVFLDLRKAYDSVSRQRLLLIMKEYGIGERTATLIEKYWTTQQVAIKQSGFYGKAFSPGRGVIQGDVLSPTLFNLVIDTIVRQLCSEIDENETGRIQSMCVFYADDGYLGGTNPNEVQQMTNKATSMFETLGLAANATKTKAMVNSIVTFNTGISIEAYARRWDEDVPSFQEKQKSMVTCPLCKVGYQRATIPRHLKYVHNQNSNTIDDLLKKDTDNPTRVRGVVHISKDSVECPKDGCPYKGSNGTNLRKHLRSRHPWDEVESEDMTLARCPNCLVYLMGETVSQRHLNSADCNRWTERNGRLLQESAHLKQKNMQFSVSGEKVENVNSYRYLGRDMSEDNDDWMTIHSNMKKAKGQWARIRTILKQETSSIKTMSSFYKAVVQSILLYGSETWVIDETMRNRLEAFHNQVARSLTKQYIRPDTTDEDGEWIYPATSETLHKAFLRPLSEYIKVRKETLRNSVEGKSRLLDQCKRIRKPAPLVWWK